MCKCCRFSVGLSGRDIKLSSFFGHGNFKKVWKRGLLVLVEDVVAQEAMGKFVLVIKARGSILLMRGISEIGLETRTWSNLAVN